jgi:hypothetical protein
MRRRNLFPKGAEGGHDALIAHANLFTLVARDHVYLLPFPVLRARDIGQWILLHLHRGEIAEELVEPGHFDWFIPFDRSARADAPLINPFDTVRNASCSARTVIHGARSEEDQERALRLAS